MDELTDVTRKSERSWFYEKYGCTPGCSIPLALILVSVGFLFIDSARSGVSLMDRIESGDTSDGFDSHTGLLQSSAPLGDALLRPGPYVVLEREVEYYQWVERAQEEMGPTDIDGDRTVTTTYSYSKEWTKSPVDSARFERRKGHENPPPTVKTKVLWAQGAALGQYRLPTKRLDAGGGAPLTPTADQLMPRVRLKGGYVHLGGSGFPDVGDERVTYKALRVGGEATFFGKVTPHALEPMPYTSSPACILRPGPPEQAARTARRDLTSHAIKACVFAWLIAMAGIQTALAAMVIWVQRSNFTSVRKGIHIILSVIAGVSAFVVMAPSALAIVQLDAPFLAVWIPALVVTLVGLLAFRILARRGKEMMETSWVWRFILDIDRT